jgi:hypothetical protein
VPERQVEVCLSGAQFGCQGQEVLELELNGGWDSGLSDPRHSSDLLFAELLSDWRELPSIPSVQEDGGSAEDSRVREFCRHTHNTQDSCAHKHVRVRTTNTKRAKVDGVGKVGPSSDEGDLSALSAPLHPWNGLPWLVERYC